MICDGFVGNVVLKFAEGLAMMIMGLIRDAIVEGGVTAKLGAVLLAPTLKQLGKRLDASEYGGAPLLLRDKSWVVECKGNLLGNRSGK